MKYGTVKNGAECVFMKKSGSSYNGGTCRTIVENREGCSRIVEMDSGQYCSGFPYPSQKWQSSVCPMATHIKKVQRAEEQKLNSLKASKRSAGKKPNPFCDKCRVLAFVIQTTSKESRHGNPPIHPKAATPG